MKIPISKAVLTASLLFLVTTVAGAVGEGDSAPQKAAPAADNFSRVLAQMWWHQTPKVTTLELTSEQRAKLDSLGRAYLEQRRDSSAQREAFDAFSESLKENDWVTARRRARILADATAEPFLAQAEMMIEALQLLSDEQRKKLAVSFPGLLSGPWLRSGAALRGWRGNRARGGR